MAHNATFSNLIEPRLPIGSQWNSLARTVIGWFAVIALCFFLAGGILSSKDAPIVFFLWALFFLIALKNEFHGYVIATALAFYSSYLVYLFSLGSLYLMLSYMLVLSLFARRFGDTLFHIRIVKSPLNKVILLLSIFMLFSLGVNGGPFAAALKGIIKHLTFMLLFLIVANSNLTESSLKKIIGMIGIIALVQIPASIIQYGVIYADYEPGARVDLSAGLLGFSSGDLNAVFMTFMVSILFGFIINFGPRFRYLFIAAVLPITMILSSARAGLIFFLLTPLFQATLVPFIQKRNRLHKTLVTLLAVALVGAGGFLMAKSDQTSFIMDSSAVYEYSMKAKGGLGRLQSIGFVHETIGNGLLKSLFGYGPGALTPTRFLGTARSDFYQENELDHFNDYAYVALELGYGGLLLNLYLLYRLFIFNRMFLRRCPDKFWQAISLGLAGIIFTSVYSIVYARGWTQPPLAFTLWFLAGAITRIAYLKGVLTDRNVPSTVRLAG